MLSGAFLDIAVYDYEQKSRKALSGLQIAIKRHEQNKNIA